MKQNVEDNQVFVRIILSPLDGSLYVFVADKNVEFNCNCWN